MLILPFNKSCFCIEQKTVCFIVAYFLLALNVAMLLLTILFMFMAVSLNHTKYFPEILLGFIFTSQDSTIFLIPVYGLIFNVVLLIGLHENKPRYIVAFIGYLVLFTILMIISVISVCITDSCSLIKNYAIIITILTIVFTISYVSLLMGIYPQIKAKEKTKRTSTTIAV